MLLLPLFLKDKSHDDDANILPPYKRMGRHMLSLAQFHKMFLKTINVIHIIIIITTITTTTTIGDIIIIEPVWLGMWLINWHPSRSPDFHPGYLCRLTTSWYGVSRYQDIKIQGIGVYLPLFIFKTISTCFKLQPKSWWKFHAWNKQWNISSLKSKMIEVFTMFTKTSVIISTESKDCHHKYWWIIIGNVGEKPGRVARPCRGGSTPRLNSNEVIFIKKTKREGRKEKMVSSCFDALHCNEEWKESGENIDNLAQVFDYNPVFDYLQ